MPYKLRRFPVGFNFLKFCSIFAVMEKLKNSIFEDPIISQTLSIKNYKKIKNTEMISLHIIRNLMKKSLKILLVETMFTFTVFQILLLEFLLVLRPTQRFPGTKMVKFNWKTKKMFNFWWYFLKNDFVTSLGDFEWFLLHFILFYFLFCLNLSVLEKVKKFNFEILIVPQTLSINN